MWSYCDLPQSGVRFQRCDAPTTLDSGASRNDGWGSRNDEKIAPLNLETLPHKATALAATRLAAAMAVFVGGEGGASSRRGFFEGDALLAGGAGQARQLGVKFTLGCGVAFGVCLGAHFFPPFLSLVQCPEHSSETSLD